ncbi:MAG: OmpA family protein [Chitinophagales bacterium]|nr:OmpA family protein [Chitinophagales bacterium]
MIFMVSVPHSVDGQSSKIKRADEFYYDFKFHDAARLYKKVVKKHATNLHALERLANCYRLLNNSKEAAKWYDKVVLLDKSDPINFFYYAQMLRSNEQYESAEYYYNEYAKLVPDDSRGSKLAGSIKDLKSLKQESPRFEVTRTNLNTKYSEFGPIFYKSGIVFSSNRKADSYVRRTDNWTERPFLQLYYAEQNMDGTFENPTLFEGKQPNRIYHEGPIAFNMPNNEMYLTRSNYEMFKAERSSDKTIKLKLYKLTLRNGDWINLEEAVHFNSNEYSVGLPTITKDGMLMIFVSDMPGGYGGSDLYKCYRDDGGWSDPVNLGNEVNTPGNELFPYIATNGDLYFSSDGHIGLGGLDVYVAEQRGEEEFSGVKNLGSPINSSSDDFGYIFDPVNQKGFFSSDRNNNPGDDDIYSFEKFNLTAKISVLDDKTDEPLQGAEVALINTGSNKGVIGYTNSYGIAEFEIQPDKEYKIVASKDVPDPNKKYLTKSKLISTLDTRHLSKFKESISIELVEKEVPIVLNNIYYDLGKYYIRDDAKPSLDSLVAILKDNPTMQIELSSHTDSRSSDSYNLTLSAKRAKSAVDYIASQGVDVKRIVAVGYGETRLRNYCSNGIQCTESQHQQNRRTEFTILRF